MAFGVGNKIPKNSILRQGTLLIGVPRRKKPSEVNAMLAAQNDLEAALQEKIAEANAPYRQSASTTRKRNETT